MRAEGSCYGTFLGGDPSVGMRVWGMSLPWQCWRQSWGVSALAVDKFLWRRATVTFFGWTVVGLGRADMEANASLSVLEAEICVCRRGKRCALSAPLPWRTSCTVLLPFCFTVTMALFLILVDPAKSKLVTWEGFSLPMVCEGCLGIFSCMLSCFGHAEENNAVSS